MILNELLKSKGVKQNWIAKKLGVSEVTVSNWCQGKSEPSKKNLSKLSTILEVPLSELVSK